MLTNFIGPSSKSGNINQKGNNTTISQVNNCTNQFKCINNKYLNEFKDSITREYWI